MKLVGLTGGISTGKSSASNFFKASGIKVVDADVIARNTVSIKSPALKLITKEFGSQVINQQGQLDRKALAALVFTSEEKRKKLNSITHFYILLDMILDVLLCFITFESMVALDTPLLFEGRLQKYCSLSLLVYWYIFIVGMLLAITTRN